jgi:hypothetical protein
MPPITLLLSPLQLAQLVPLVPIMLAWLRHCEPKNAADLLLTGQATMDEVQTAMRELINTVSYNNGDITNTQARYILNCHRATTWAAAIRVIMQESDPRVVPNEVGGALIAALNKIHDAGDDTDEVARILGHLLDQIPRTSYNAVAEFCAFIRDTSSDQNQMAVLFGPVLLAPRGPLPPTTSSSAAAIMDFLISEAETIFGRVAGYHRKDAMGVRKTMPQLPARRMSRQLMGGGVASPQMPLSPKSAAVAPPPGFGPPSDIKPMVSRDPKDIEADMKKARDTKRRDQLRAFFQIRANDRVKDLSDIVDALFENHDFEDIARGIWDRYHMLPPGWQHDLTDVRNQGSGKLDWFDDALNALQRSKNGRLSYVPRARPSQLIFTKNDQIINEIIDTEETYRDNLAELVELFINPVREIAQEKKGKEAAEELGVSPAEIERIFGWRIGEIVKVSANLQKKLEVVNICRGPVKSPLGREGIVGQAFLEISNDLHVYAPYVSAHKTSLQFLDKAIEACSNKGEKKGVFGAGLLRGKEKEAMSFVKMWEVVSSSSPRLKGQSIASLLIMPIQRVPRYMLLLRELSKSMPDTHPSSPLLKAAMEKTGESARQINEALRQHEKLEKFFGSEDMLSPMSSEGGRGGKIKQGYVDA